MQAWIDGHPLLFGAVFGFCLWNGLCVLLSFISGWGLLARKYRLRGHFDGKRWEVQYGRVGPISIRGGLILGANSEGLYLGMIPLFRPGHPPLLIPWKDTSVPREQSFFLPSMDFQVGSKPSVFLSVSAESAEQIVHAARSSQVSRMG